MKKQSESDPGMEVKNALVHDIRVLIEETRQRISITVNSGLTFLYWKIGKRIELETLNGKRAEYGSEIVSTLGKQLEVEFGKGFSIKMLRRMIQFYKVFPDEKIVVSLIRQLSWTHFIAIIPLNDTLKIEFYTEMCRLENWSVRTLRKKIDSMLYERTVLSTKPQKMIREELNLLRDNGTMSPDLVFRDPYILDFLGLKDTYHEKDLEASILREMESFILEIGVGFAFLERQKRIIVDDTDYYIDLLFYHRHLQRLVVIELKLGEFKPEHKGQMELYLKWLDKYERGPHENSPLGLILCAGKKYETIKLLDLELSGIKVSQYWTEALPKEMMEKKLHEAVSLAKARIVTSHSSSQPSPSR
jgi:predicted nuclease of restriction endonuclease-like (RecB) superfamily